MMATGFGVYRGDPLRRKYYCNFEAISITYFLFSAFRLIFSSPDRNEVRLLIIGNGQGSSSNFV